VREGDFKMTPPKLVRLEAGEKQIADVFSDKYAFTIPPYQRPYAWEVPQVTELLDDLIDAMDPKSRSEGLYFLGSIVLVKVPGNPDSKVVDGQQRLTTLSILFSVLRDLTDDDRLRFKRDEYVKQPADTDRNLPERLRLHLRKRDQPFFAKTIQKEGATKDLPRLEGLQGSQARIVENATILRARLSAMTEDERAKLIAFILSNCFLVVVEVPADAAARRIFTVLNARGMDLAATDILKADLLERAGEAREGELSTRWENIEIALDRSRFNDLFGHIRMIFQREKARNSLEDGFSEDVTPYNGDPEAFLSLTLEPFADAFELADDQSSLEKLFGAKTAALLRSLNRLDNKDWIPPLLLRLKQYAANQAVDIPDFVKRLERLAYYLFVVRADVNERISRYADVLDQIDPRDGKPPKTRGIELDDQDTRRLFDEMDGSIYLKSRVAKPLLLRLDQALSDGSATYDYSTISVEHVCPQTIENGTQWDEWFADREAHGEWLHRLANLVLLTHRKNSSASNWDLDKKRTKYFVRGEACPFVLTGEVLEVTEWTPEALAERQKHVLRALAKDWDIASEFDSWQLINDLL
tara:strand:+ start:3635 stop:5383 length:1749 start_codon:yes stop_codon:yes gene_type:complete